MDSTIYVIVTTQHRGVFFGEIDQNTIAERDLTVKNCRNILYWAGKKGFLGLAADGPEPESRLGSTADITLLHDVTSVSVCTDQAAKKLREWK